MKYQYFIETVTDKSRGEYDLFIMVPVLRASSNRLSAWSSFLGANNLHAYLSIPMDDTQIRFQILIKRLNGKKYPVLRLHCSRYGVFTVPFEPNKAGLAHLHETYKGIRALFVNSKKISTGQAPKTAPERKRAEVSTSGSRQSQIPISQGQNIAQAKPTKAEVIPLQRAARSRGDETVGARLRRSVMLGCVIGTGVIATLHISGVAASEHSSTKSALESGGDQPEIAHVSKTLSELPLPVLKRPNQAKQSPPCTVASANASSLNALNQSLVGSRNEDSDSSDEAAAL
ncbi:hypothetical protein EZI54_07210 [Marinobacter halodurans]|uniref:Uncharacterized protein n=1 Tax=Marinobacter halodurans TaxID=2528979 RepID=A0ABY1ZRF0_9GAMM|nr:hypothetical protein [Marinobacter halodurans]TBW57440.1 hypothetical protein EZI54_07210 [Marinobacter halodurans]